jgi:hypothetical protein
LILTAEAIEKGMFGVLNLIGHCSVMPKLQENNRVSAPNWCFSDLDPIFHLLPASREATPASPP